MPKLHIALVGGQTTPVFQGIEHVKPDQIILLPSSDTHKYAEEVRTQFYDIPCDIYDIPVDDIPAIQNFAITVAESIPAYYEVSLNLSGGPKPWAMIFIEIFKMKLPQSQIYYIYQGGKLINMSRYDEVGEVNFNYKAQFEMLGHSLSNYTLFADYTSEDDEVLTAIESMYSQNARQFTTFMYGFCNFVGKRHLSPETNIDYFSEGSEAHWSATNNTMTIDLVGKPRLVISSPHVWNLATNTGWYEYHVAKVLAQIYPADQMFLNCRFKDSNDIDLNEVDIIINTGKKLLFVECKTQIHDSNDVDKFASVVRNYGALSSKSLFVTSRTMYPNGKEKCDNCGIPTYVIPIGDPYELHKEPLQARLDKIINSSNVR